MQRTNNITEGNIRRQLLLFFFPILFGTFFQQLYSTVDTIIVGRIVGKQALAAIGVTEPFIQLLVGFFTGLSSGAGVIISQCFGARDNTTVTRCVRTAAALSLAAGAAFTLLGLLCAPGALSAMQTPTEVLPMAIRYIRIYFTGMVPLLFYNMGTAILRAVGDSRRPLYFLIAASLLNVLLDLLFVAGLGMGVDGAALGTVLSQCLAAVLVLLSLLRAGEAPYALTLRRPLLDRDLLLRMVRIGLPAGLQSVLYTISNLVIQVAINTFDTDAIAAWTVYGKMDGIFWMAISSMGLSITTFSGQNFGAGKYERLREGLRVSMKISFFITAVSVSFFMAFTRPLFLFFNDDPAVLAIGVDMIHFLMPCYFLYICIENFSGLLRGTGDTLIPTLIACVGVCVLRLLWIWLVLPLRPTLNTVMTSYPITWGIASAAYLIYYRRGNWLRRRITAMGMTPPEDL